MQNKTKTLETIILSNTTKIGLFAVLSLSVLLFGQISTAHGAEKIIKKEMMREKMATSSKQMERGENMGSSTATSTMMSKRDKEMERDTKIKDKVGKVNDRLNAAADRLDVLAGRITSRMQKLTDAGADVSKEKVLVDDAPGLVIKARGDIASSTAMMQLMATSTISKEKFTKTKTAYAGIEETLKKAQKKLVDAVTLLAKEKRTVKLETKKATSTKTSN